MEFERKINSKSFIALRNSIEFKFNFKFHLIVQLDVIFTLRFLSTFILVIWEVQELGRFIGERRMVVEAKEGKLRKRVILHKSKF